MQITSEDGTGYLVVALTKEAIEKVLVSRNQRTFTAVTSTGRPEFALHTAVANRHPERKMSNRTFSYDEARVVIENYARAISQREITEPDKLVHIAHRMALLADSLADPCRAPEHRSCNSQDRILSIPLDEDFALFEQIDGELIVTITNGEKVVLPLPLRRVKIDRRSPSSGQSSAKKIRLA